MAVWRNYAALRAVAVAMASSLDEGTLGGLQAQFGPLGPLDALRPGGASRTVS